MSVWESIGSAASPHPPDRAPEVYAAAADGLADKAAPIGVPAPLADVGGSPWRSALPRSCGSAKRVDSP